MAAQTDKQTKEMHRQTNKRNAQKNKVTHRNYIQEKLMKLNCTFDNIHGGA